MPESMSLKENVFVPDVTLLNERTNVNRLASKEPWRYIRQYNLRREALEAHMIPDKFLDGTESDKALKERWDVRNYHDFILERALLLAQEANKFLESLRGT